MLKLEDIRFPISFSHKDGCIDACTFKDSSSRGKWGYGGACGDTVSILSIERFIKLVNDGFMYYEMQPVRVGDVDVTCMSDTPTESVRTMASNYEKESLERAGGIGLIGRHIMAKPAEPKSFSISNGKMFINAAGIGQFTIEKAKILDNLPSNNFIVVDDEAEQLRTLVNQVREVTRCPSGEGILSHVKALRIMADALAKITG